MKVLVLAALLAVAACGRLSSDANFENETEWPWQTGKLYRYDVEALTLTHQKEGASSGHHFRARFNVRVVAPGHLQAKLENPQNAIVHQVLTNKRDVPEDLKYEPVKNIDQQFEFNVEKGRVVSLNLPSSMSLSHENLIKGLLGGLQVDLSATRNLYKDHDSYNKVKHQGLFSKMETDVTGDCETLYSVSPVASEWRRELPNFASEQEPIEITKSKDYGRCNHRVAYHFGVPEGAVWAGKAKSPKEQQFMDQSTTIRVLVGKQGPIYKSETTHIINVSPQLYGKQKAEVVSIVRLYLATYEQDQESQWQQLEGGRPIKNLLYALSSKQVDIDDNGMDSGESQGLDVKAYEAQNRLRRSLKSVDSINQVINKRLIDLSSSSSSESASVYINDDIPNDNEPAYAALYMQPQAHVDKKQNPMNAQKLVQEAAQLLHNPNNMPKADFLSKFNILVRVIASMSLDQLTQTSRSIEIGKSSNNMVKIDMWMIYRDAVVQAGTLPAFQQIKSWILNGKIQNEEAAQVLASLVSTLRYPTKAIMTEFFNLAMSPEVRQQKYLNSTAVIAATRFINQGQVNNDTAHSYYPTHMYGRLTRQHDRFVLDDVLPRLEKALEEAIQQGDSHKAQVHVKAIGNIGHREILQVFAPYLEGKIPVTKYLRTQIVANLQVLAHERDHHVRAVLYSIARNTAEPYEVRVAAIENIFMARPTDAMMQTFAQMTHDDPSLHVRAALKSAILSAAQLKNPRYWDLARSAQHVKHMLTKENLGYWYSTKHFLDSYEQQQEIGIMSVLSYIGSEDCLFPQQLKLSLKRNANGWDKENSIAVAFSSARQFVKYFTQQYRREDNSDVNHKYSAEKVAQMLNIKKDADVPFESSFLIDLMNQQRYFTLSQEDVKQLPRLMQQYIENLSKGVDIHYTKVLNNAQVSVMFPVASGMPFIYKYKEPTVIHIQGKVKSQMNYPSADKDFSSSIDSEIQFTFATNIDGRVGFMDTLSNQYASVGVVNKLQLNLPFKLQMEMKPRKFQVHVEPLHIDQDTTVVHYSVWPYTSIQKKDSLTTISQDPTTKLINRNKKVANVDVKYGQNIGTQFHLQGYSFSWDYKNLLNMFQGNDLLSNIASLRYQNDVAQTHFNLRHLVKQSQNKGFTLYATYDKYYNQKQEGEAPKVAAPIEDMSPNSEARRQEMIKRVVRGINTARGQVLDISAVFEGSQKSEYVLTAAIGDSLVDSKIQYAFYAGRNSAQLGNTQVSAVANVVKPEITTLNFLEALKKELKLTFEADIRYGQDNSGNIQIQGYGERTKKYTEELQKHALAEQSKQEIANDNYYQYASHRMIIMAHAPDYFKASIIHKNGSPLVKNWAYQVYRIIHHFGFWYSEVNPFKTLPDGRVDIEAQTSYFEHSLNFNLNSRNGFIKYSNVPIPRVSSGTVSLYSPFKPYERVLNHYTCHQYQPYIIIDGNKIKTFSNRTYDYTLSSSWHVVIHDDGKYGSQRHYDDQLVILARRPSQKQLETYISYITKDGQHLEIQIQPDSVQVKTNTQKVSEGDLTIYWDVVREMPLLQYFTQQDGVLMLNIHENRLRLAYDGQRLLVLDAEHRDNIRGIGGYMNGEPRDDYLTPYGIVDRPDLYAASYALDQESVDQQTQQLHDQAKLTAYQPIYKYTTILSSDKEWTDTMDYEQYYGSQNVYRSRSYQRQSGDCMVQQQVQYYENHGDICITTLPLPSCQASCKSLNYQVQSTKVVCAPKLDQQFRQYRDLIRQGENPRVTGETRIRQFKVPSSCQA